MIILKIVYDVFQYKIYKQHEGNSERKQMDWLWDGLNKCVGWVIYMYIQYMYIVEKCNIYLYKL